MNRTTFLALLLVPATFTMPVFADTDMKPSFANKKNGHVAFQAKEQTEDAATTPAQETDPSQVEPAAGAEDAENAAQDENKLADDLKLPRKN